MVQVSDSENEPVTCGSPYNFIVLNSPVTGHLGKRSQLVKPIMIKFVFLEEGHAWLPKYKILDI